MYPLFAKGITSTTLGNFECKNNFLPKNQKFINIETVPAFNDIFSCKNESKLENSIGLIFTKKNTLSSILILNDCCLTAFDKDQKESIYELLNVILLNKFDFSNVLQKIPKEDSHLCNINIIFDNDFINYFLEEFCCTMLYFEFIFRGMASKIIGNRPFDIYINENNFTLKVDIFDKIILDNFTDILKIDINNTFSTNSKSYEITLDL